MMWRSETAVSRGWSGWPVKAEHVRVRRPAHGLALFGCTIASLAAGWLMPSLSYADSSMSWSRAVIIDPAGTVFSPSELSGVSCPSGSLCVAVDRAGNVVSSNDPAGGASGWHVADVDPPSSAGCVVGGCHGLTGISCPSASFCAAVDDQGNVLTSATPLGGPSSWRSVDIDSTNAGCGYAGDCYGLSAISCPSASFCAAVDAVGNVITSTDPAGGASAWHLTDVDRSAAAWCTPGSGCFGLSNVSCPSASLCVAVDYGFNVLVSTRPAAGKGSWRSIPVQAGVPNPGSPGVSCSSSLLCVAVDRVGDAYGSTGPSSGLAAWLRTNIDGDGSERYLSDVVCAPRTSLCIASDTAGNVVSSSSPMGGPAAWRITTLPFPCGCTTLLSCASGRFCLAVAGGEAVVGKGSPPPPPVNTSRPRVSGRPLVGRTLTEGRGRWRNQPSTFAYRWERCDRAGKRCKAIPGADGSTYTVRASDLRHAIRVQETALNGGGTGRTATSRPVQVKPARIRRHRAN